MFSWQNPEESVYVRPGTKNNNDCNNKQTESSWSLFRFVVCLTGSARERCGASATDLDLDSDDLQTDQFQSGSR